MSCSQKPRVMSLLKTPSFNNTNNLTLKETCPKQVDHHSKVRVFNVLDDHNREAIAVRAERSFPADRVVEVLEQLSRDRGLPKRIRVDNGPEFISQVFTQWCAAKGVEVHHIQPGKPAQNAYIERFNRTFREDVLDAYIFDDLEQLQLMAEQWAYDYNHNHPHTALGGISPIKYSPIT